MLKNKVAIVTGATSGIGEGILERYAKEGAKVAFCGRREEKGKSIESNLKEQGYDVKFIKADMMNDSDVKNLIDTTIETYGKIDILVNNAGMLRHFEFDKLDMKKDYDDVFDLNIRSYFLSCKLALEHMIKQGSGNIINISSIGALNGGPNIASYSASKGAVVQLSRSLAKEFGPKGIRTNIISPGLVFSEMMPEGDEFTNAALEMTPLKRGAHPSEIGSVATFLASEESSFINGANIVVDGGLSA